jgi:hypothetical protein
MYFSFPCEYNFNSLLLFPNILTLPHFQSIIKS